MDPELSTRAVTLTFPHSWKAEILTKRPLIKPLRCYTYPREAEDVERGALEVMVQPPGEGLRFLATFALGFNDPAVSNGLWSCPAVEELCAVAGGYAYIVNTLAPGEFTHIALRPVLEIVSLAEQRLLVFVGHHALLAWGVAGEAWRTPPLTAEGLRLAEIDGDDLHGFGWDLRSDREIPFTVDLRTGRCSGAYVDSAR
jgi:hypothetical protein